VCVLEGLDQRTLTDGPQDVVGAVISALGVRLEGASIAPLTTFLNRREGPVDASLQAAAADLLARYGLRARHALAEQLLHPNQEVRSKVVAALDQFAWQPSQSELARYFLASGRAADAAGLRDAAKEAISDWAASSDAALRRSAATALCFLAKDLCPRPSPGLTPWTLELAGVLARDENSDIQLEAFKTIGKLATKEAVDAILSPLSPLTIHQRLEDCATKTAMKESARFPPEIRKLYGAVQAALDKFAKNDLGYLVGKVGQGDFYSEIMLIPVFCRHRALDTLEKTARLAVPDELNLVPKASILAIAEMDGGYEVLFRLLKPHQPQAVREVMLRQVPRLPTEAIGFMVHRIMEIPVRKPEGQLDAEGWTFPFLRALMRACDGRAVPYLRATMSGYTDSPDWHQLHEADKLLEWSESLPGKETDPLLPHHYLARLLWADLEQLGRGALDVLTAACNDPVEWVRDQAESSLARVEERMTSSSRAPSQPAPVEPGQDEAPGEPDAIPSMEGADEAADHELEPEEDSEAYRDQGSDI
jgi:hypothetical protein